MVRQPSPFLSHTLAVPAQSLFGWKCQAPSKHSLGTPVEPSPDDKQR